jgi:hypothetical protein
MSVSLFAIEGIAQDSKCETKVLSENGKPSLITFNENQLINRQILKSIQGTIRIKGYIFYFLNLNLTSRVFS